MTAIGFALAATGCAAPAANLRVEQPSPTSRQREMQLVSDWGYFTHGEPRDRYLLLFPLPGATGGDEQFVLYVRAATGQGERGCGPLLPAAPRFDGFFIQTRGDRPGLTNFMSGIVAVKGGAFGGKNRRRLELQIQCEDGTVLMGKSKVEYDRFRLRDFEDRHLGDIAVLDGSGPVAENE